MAKESPWDKTPEQLKLEASKQNTSEVHKQTVFLLEILGKIGEAVEKNKTVKVENTIRQVIGEVAVTRPEWIKELIKDTKPIEQKLDSIVSAIIKKEVVKNVDINRPSWLKELIPKEIKFPKAEDYSKPTTQLLEKVLKAINDKEIVKEVSITNNVKIAKPSWLKFPDFDKPFVAFAGFLKKYLDNKKFDVDVKNDLKVDIKNKSLDVNILNEQKKTDLSIIEENLKLVTAQLRAIGNAKGGGGGSQKTELVTLDKNVSAQNPLPTDGDSVYCKDIDVARSDLGDFSGKVCDLFDDLFSDISNVGSDNPKTLTVIFNRTIEAHSIGIGCLSDVGNYSNVVLKLIDGSGNVRKTIDYSTDDTKHKSFDYKFTPEKFDGFILEFHTADPVCITNIVIKKSVNVTSRIDAVSDLTGEVESITSYRKALNVNNAWVNRKIVNETFHSHDSAITSPAVGITLGDVSATVNSVVGFSIGDVIKLEEDVDGVGIQEIGVLTITAIDIPTELMTFDRPISNDYSDLATIERVVTDMNVFGTLENPVAFIIDPPLGTVWQFTSILISMVHVSAGDDGKFGGIAKLTNGVSLRATTASGRTVTYANWKTNGDMSLDMFDVDYTDKAPAGANGTKGRWTFTKAEVVAELDGRSEEIQKLEVLIQDDLTGLISFHIRAQGRVFSP